MDWVYLLIVSILSDLFLSLQAVWITVARNRLTVNVRCQTSSVHHSLGCNFRCSSEGPVRTCDDPAAAAAHSQPSTFLHCASNRFDVLGQGARSVEPGYFAVLPAATNAGPLPIVRLPRVRSLWFVIQCVVELAADVHGSGEFRVKITLAELESGCWADPSAEVRGIMSSLSTDKGHIP